MNKGIFLLVGAIGAGLVLVVMNVVGTSLFESSSLSSVKSTQASYKDLMDSIQTQCSNIKNFDVVTSKTVELRVSDRDKIGYDVSEIYYERNGQEIERRSTPQNCVIEWNTINGGNYIGGNDPEFNKWEAELSQESNDVLKIEVRNR